jgi:hypothetical protein
MFPLFLPGNPAGAMGGHKRTPSSEKLAAGGSGDDLSAGALIWLAGACSFSVEQRKRSKGY